LVGNKDFLQILKKKIFKKNYPACKELSPCCCIRLTWTFLTDVLNVLPRFYTDIMMGIL